MKELTYEMVNGMTYGDEIDLGNNQTIYHYCEEDIIVVVNTEEWYEHTQILLDHEKKDLVFELI